MRKWSVSNWFLNLVFIELAKNLEDKELLRDLYAIKEDTSVLNKLTIPTQVFRRRLTVNHIEPQNSMRDYHAADEDKSHLTVKYQK